MGIGEDVNYFDSWDAAAFRLELGRAILSVRNGRGRLAISFAPSGLVHLLNGYPRLAPWAAFFRRFAAGVR